MELVKGCGETVGGKLGKDLRGRLGNDDRKKNCSWCTGNRKLFEN